MEVKQKTKQQTLLNMPRRSRFGSALSTRRYEKISSFHNSITNTSRSINNRSIDDYIRNNNVIDARVRRKNNKNENNALDIIEDQKHNDDRKNYS